jgi:hypothetical protein
VAGAEDSRSVGSRPGSRLESRSEKIRPGSLGKKRQKRARLAEALGQQEVLECRDIAATDVSYCEKLESS